MARGADAREDRGRRLGLVEHRLDQPRLAQLRAQLRGRPDRARPRLRRGDGSALPARPCRRGRDRSRGMEDAWGGGEAEGVVRPPLGIPAVDLATKGIADMTATTARAVRVAHFDLPPLP